MSDPISSADRLDYAWKHFALIADQRMKTFNFYLIVDLTGAVSPHLLSANRNMTRY